MRRAALALAVTVACVAGCNGILGWDAATLDPGDECHQYCAAMEANCTGDNLKYISDDVCLKICGVFDSGGSDQQSGDNVACRLHFARDAATPSSAAAACENAGPLGGDACNNDKGDDLCRAFCEIDTAYCGTIAYADFATCLANCGSNAYPYTADKSVVADQGSNTLNCRLYHLEAAFPGTAAHDTHCPHTKQASITCN